VLARETREIAFYRRGVSWRGGNTDVHSSASHCMARSGGRRATELMPNGARRCGRLERAGVAPTRVHPRQAQEPEHSARTDGHRPASVCACTAAEPMGRGRGDVTRGVHIPPLVVGGVFEVMAQVDHCLTKVN
jgi:hypothetical protein